MQPLSPKNHVTTTTILMRAAEIMRERGMTRHDLYNSDGVCIHGAIILARSEATGKDTANNIVSCNQPEEKRLAAYLKATKGIEPDSQKYQIGNATWNNRPESTKEEMIAALEGAAMWEPETCR